MESLIAAGIIIIVFGLIGYAVWTAANSWRPHLKEEEEIWQQLAEAQKLNFLPTGNLPDTYVSGTYRGHFLTLRTQDGATYGDTQTRVSLNRQQAIDDKTDLQVLNGLAGLAELETLKGTLGAEEGGNCLFYDQPGVETDINYLRSVFGLLDKLITIYPKVIKLGGEAVPVLQELGQKYEAFQPLGVEMIKDLAQASVNQFGGRLAEVWCPRCLTRFEAIEIDLSGLTSVVYCGCRICGQSREFLHLPQGLVAVLNNRETEPQAETDGMLKVNWIARQELFDFDWVEIIQATDEEIERFAVQVGNDTDAWREPRYKDMACVISPDCELMANTDRILQKMFGQVTQSNHQ